MRLTSKASHVGQLDTIAKALGCLGPPLHTLHLDLPGLHMSSLEKFITSVGSSHTLKRVDFCDTPMSRVCQDWLHAIAGPDTNITVLGGIIDDGLPANARSRDRKLPAAALSEAGLKSVSR